MDPISRAIVKWCVVGAAVCVLVLVVHSRAKTAGRAEVQAEWNAAVLRGMKEIDRLKTAADKVTVRVETRYIDRIVTVEGKTREIVRQVPVLVPADACELPGGFRLLHDAAARNEPVSDPAGLADAAPVEARTAAVTVAENYGTCHVIAARLNGLQEWIREQQKVNPGD